MAPIIEDNAVVLFQGDSITDAGWDRKYPSYLGWGYAAMTAGWFSMLYPEKRVEFINRAVSGNRVKDLQARWKADCIDLRPTWVSIMIGINDVWCRYTINDPVSCEAYTNGYRDILTQTRDIGAKLILLEPFVLPTAPDRLTWREDINLKIDAVRALAIEFGAVYIPLDGLFAAACTRREPAFWGVDGVHPSHAGHAFIANEWLKAVKAI